MKCQATYEIFLVDFLIYSFYFCAAAFVEFACVNYGAQCQAWLKANPGNASGSSYDVAKVQPDEGVYARGGMSPPASLARLRLARLTRRWTELCAKLVHLDVICRFAFPIVYGIYALHAFSGGLAIYMECANSAC